MSRAGDFGGRGPAAKAERQNSDEDTAGNDVTADRFVRAVRRLGFAERPAYPRPDGADRLRDRVDHPGNLCSSVTFNEPAVYQWQRRVDRWYSAVAPSLAGSLTLGRDEPDALVALHRCGQVARPLLGGGTGGRSPGLL